ncbi:hypothetical protein, partial [Wohlfahrtiimonas larvae]
MKAPRYIICTGLIFSLSTPFALGLVTEEGEIINIQNRMIDLPVAGNYTKVDRITTLGVGKSNSFLDIGIERNNSVAVYTIRGSLTDSIIREYAHGKDNVKAGVVSINTDGGVASATASRLAIYGELEIEGESILSDSIVLGTVRSAQNTSSVSKKGISQLTGLTVGRKVAGTGVDHAVREGTVIVSDKAHISNTTILNGTVTLRTDNN